MCFEPALTLLLNFHAKKSESDLRKFSFAQICGGLLDQNELLNSRKHPLAEESTAVKISHERAKKVSQFFVLMILFQVDKLCRVKFNANFPHDTKSTAEIFANWKISRLFFECLIDFIICLPERNSVRMANRCKQIIRQNAQ